MYRLQAEPLQQAIKTSKYPNICAKLDGSGYQARLRLGNGKRWKSKVFQCEATAFLCLVRKIYREGMEMECAEIIVRWLPESEYEADRGLFYQPSYQASPKQKSLHTEPTGALWPPMTVAVRNELFGNEED